MSLNDLSDLGQFISSVAVLGSLIYVAVQIRQTERNQRALIMEGRAARSSTLSTELAHPELASVFAKITTAPGELTATEFWQFRFIIRAAAANLENLFFQHKQGLIDDAGFESMQNVTRAFFSNPSIQAMWQVMVRAEFNTEFAAYLDEIIAEGAGPTAPWSDAQAPWKALVAEKMAAT